MIKYILPAIIIFLIVLFWEQITEFVEKKFNIKLNYIVVSSIIAAIAVILLLLFKNENTTIGFVRFNEKGEVEYIFVNPIFRKQGLATKLLLLVKQKTGKEIILQEPISPLGSKLLKSLNKWK